MEQSTIYSIFRISPGSDTERTLEESQSDERPINTAVPSSDNKILRNTTSDGNALCQNDDPEKRRAGINRTKKWRSQRTLPRHSWHKTYLLLSFLALCSLRARCKHTPHKPSNYEQPLLKKCFESFHRCTDCSGSPLFHPEPCLLLTR